MVPHFPVIYCNEIKENYIHATSCFICLCRTTTLLPNRALLALALTNANDIHLSVLITSYLTVIPDNYSPLALDFKLTLEC